MKYVDFARNYSLRPNRMSVPVATLKLAKVRPAKPMTFETALRHLRRGKAVRRRAWLPKSRIFRLGADVFVKLPNKFVKLPNNYRPSEYAGEPNEKYGTPPYIWRPYPSDFLANDWEIAR